MRLRISALLICTTLLGSGLADVYQNAWQSQYSQTNNSLNALHMIDEENGFIVGDSGIVLKTADGGQMWERINTGTTSLFRSVYFRDAMSGWIAGEQGLIMHSNSNGDSWLFQNSHITSNLNGIYFSTKTHGWCVGDNGTILKTSNEGSDWMVIENPTDKKLYDLTFNTDKPITEFLPFDAGKDIPYAITCDDQSNLYISVKEETRGVIKKMLSDGSSEYISTSTSFPKANGLKIGKDAYLYAAISAGRLRQIKQIDMMGNESVYAALDFVPEDFDFDDEGNIWVVGLDKISSIDKNRIVTDLTFTGTLTAIIVKNNSLYIAGFINDMESIWKMPVTSLNELGTPELFFNLSQIIPNNTPAIQDMEFMPDGNLYIGIDNILGILEITPDMNQAFLYEGEPLGPVYSLATVSETDFFVCRQARDESNAAILRVNPTFTGASKGWAVGADGTVLKTEDGGENWYQQNSNVDIDLTSVFALDTLHAWATGASGTLIITSDGGATWEVLSINTSSTLNAIHFLDRQTGWVAGDDGYLGKSENMGLTWYTFLDVPDIHINDVWFTDNKNGWIIGDRGEIFFTNTGAEPSPIKSNEYKWFEFGELQNWYSNMGCEIEAGREPGVAQQDGLQWPAIQNFQDMQASKGLWIGVKNFTDNKGTPYEYKVINLGPRHHGRDTFFPTKFQLIHRYQIPEIVVNGDGYINTDKVDPDLPADHMIINEVNTSLGLTMKRRIYQFTQQFHDDYIIHDYTFINTGNTDTDGVIELEGSVLTDLYIFYLYRWAICQQTRYVIGNGTGWGMNTMLDARGDGAENITLYSDPENERFRAQFGWHGYFPDKIVDYDNIGGPIWQPGPYSYVSTGDTVGRIGAGQFVGVVTLHTDVSTDDKYNDDNQPATTGYFGSDEYLTGSSYDDIPFMQSQYEWMSRGHMSPRHAWKVVPSGDFASQNTGANIPPGGPGGFSMGNGYGPLNLQFGDSIRIVWAEAVSGLSRKKCIEIGMEYKNGEIDAYAKNQWVLTGKDSLFQVFRRAIDNFNSDYTIDKAPIPPLVFRINSKEDHIDLSWDKPNDKSIQGFRIYRSSESYENEEKCIYECSADITSYHDFDVMAGVQYYYYIVSVGGMIDANEELGIAETVMVSNRYLTQTYIPVELGSTGIEQDIEPTILNYRLNQNYPNPFNPVTHFRFSVPKSQHVRIDVYNALGQKISTLIDRYVSYGHYQIEFNGTLLPSGIYYYRIQAGEFRQVKKMILLR